MIWNGDLYAGGDFTMADGQTVNGVTRFDGINWQPVGAGVDGSVRELKAYPDGLYVAGWYAHADTLDAPGLARWDGSQWHKVHDLPDLDPDIFEANEIETVAQYNGEVYIGGNFRGPDSLRYLARWDGNQWTHVDGSFLGTFGQVNELEVHDGLLYIAGAFNTVPSSGGSPLNPGSGIVAWDGQQWHTLGTGTAGSVNPAIIDMEWHDGYLYVCGHFNVIDGQGVDGLARWDGQQWCGLTPDDPGYVHGSINGLTFYRDSLFIVGGFDTIDGDTMNFVAQYVELSHTENCGPINSLIEHAMPDPPLTIHPNPTRDRIHLQWSTAGMEQLQVTDLLGQVILQQRVGPAQRSLLLDLSAAQAGSYLLKMQGTRTMHAVFIKE